MPAIMHILNNNGNQTCNFLLRILFFVLFLFFFEGSNFLNKHDKMVSQTKFIADSGSTKTEWCLFKKNKIVELHFYGTGCKNPANMKMFKKVFFKLFPASFIEVDNDLSGAAKA